MHGLPQTRTLGDMIWHSSSPRQALLWVSTSPFEGERRQGAGVAVPSEMDATPTFRELVDSKRTRAPPRTRHAKREPSPADVEAAKHGLPTLKLYMQEAYAVVRVAANAPVR